MVAYVRIFDGEIQKGKKIKMVATKYESDAIDGAHSTGGQDPYWVDNIIPNSPYSQCGDYVPSNETYIPNQADINDATTYNKSISAWFIADTIDTSGAGRPVRREEGRAQTTGSSPSRRSARSPRPDPSSWIAPKPLPRGRHEKLLVATL